MPQTLTATRGPAGAPSRRARGETLHKALMWVGICAFSALVLYLAVHGFSYYKLRLEERPLSPLHAQLRSSGGIGLRIGIVSVGLYCIIFLYPLRKRWRWLSTIGSTRRWLNYHILFGIGTPLFVTFHTTFRFHGVAGWAYWSMIVVAISGFIGRYIYAKIPHSLHAVELTISELEGQTAALGERLGEQSYFRPEDLAPLLDVPDQGRIRSMGLIQALWTMSKIDFSRPFQVSRLRRQALHGSQRIATLGGLMHSHNRDLELAVSSIRRLSRLKTATAFLDRTARIFHLWHVVHRPFSISFVALVIIHIGVAIAVGF
jgi:hypothetical protein